MAQGWVKTHRSLMDHWLWTEKPFDKARAWIDLTMTVNHKDAKIMFDGAPLEVKRGETITSIRKLSTRWGWSTTKTNKFLNVLESENMIAQKKDTKKTVLKVLNYDIYQSSDEQEKDTEVTQKRHRSNTEVTQKNTNKNDKKNKNDENVENDKNKETHNTPKGEMISKPKIDYQKFVNYWNNTCLDLPKVIKLTKSRKQAIRLRLNEFGENEILRAIDETASSDFLCGRVNSFMASFDWILKTSNLTKILEGNYKNKKNQNNYENQESSNPFLNLLQSGELSNDEVNTIF